MANDTYIADANGKVFAGRFNTTPLEIAISQLSVMVPEKYTSTNINVKYPAYSVDRQDIATLETDETRKLTNWFGKAGYDRAAKKIQLVSTSEGFLAGAKNYRGKSVTFDLKSDQFSHAYGPLAEQNEGHGYDGNSSIPDKFGQFWRTSEASGGTTHARLWKRDPITGNYTYVTSVPNLTPTNLIHACDVFPEWGTDGGVVMFGQRGTLLVWDIGLEQWVIAGLYDVSLGQWVTSTPFTADNRHFYGLCMYVNGYIVFGGGQSSTQLYKLDSLGNISAFSSSTPHIVSCERGGYKYLPSPVDGENACYSMEKDTLRMYKHDHDLDTWTDIGAVIPVSDLVQTAFTPLRGLNTFACFHGRGRQSGNDISEFWLLKVA